MDGYMKHFKSIILGALSSSLIGGLFGALIAFISPDFVSGLFGNESYADWTILVRFAAVLGMIWGLFLGFAAMALSIAVAALLICFGPKTKKEES